MLDRNAPLLFHHLEPPLPYFRSITPNCDGSLVRAFRIEGKEVGAIWAVRHDEGYSSTRRICGNWRISPPSPPPRTARRKPAALPALSRRMAALNLLEDALQSQHALGNRPIRAHAPARSATAAS